MTGNHKRRCMKTAIKCITSTTPIRTVAYIYAMVTATIAVIAASFSPVVPILNSKRSSTSESNIVFVVVIPSKRPAVVIMARVIGGHTAFARVQYLAMSRFIALTPIIDLISIRSIRTTIAAS